MRLQEQIRGVTGVGNTLGDAQRVVALRGILLMQLRNRLGDVDGMEPSAASYEMRLRWAEHQMERAHAKVTLEARPKTKGPNAVDTGGSR